MLGGVVSLNIVMNFIFVPRYGIVASAWITVFSYIIIAGLYVFFTKRQVGYRFLQGRDTHLITNVQANNQDGRQDQYLTEAGLWTGQEKTCSRLKGVQI